jgi:probable HAF family extracellular repeat protein
MPRRFSSSISIVLCITLARCGWHATGPQAAEVPNAGSSARLSAPASQNEQLAPYTITDLGTLGGTLSEANTVNDAGTAAGNARHPGDAINRAFLWRNGVMLDLGTLGGANSVTHEGHVLNASDAIAGFSETPTPDPNGEDACSFGTMLTCRAFLWRHGVMTELPTLGGNNALGEAINDRDQVIGESETRKHLSCAAPFLYEFKAFIWEQGRITALPLLPGDNGALGSAINDEGQAVGTSGFCFIARHSVLWQNGKVTDIGSLGGTDGNLPSDINNRGEVVGESQLAAAPHHHHAFLWRHGVITDLGTLPGDVDSSANSINNKGEIVGFSFDKDGNVRGAVWENGVIADMNDLIPSSSGMFVLEAITVNDRGQIGGFAAITATGQFHAFLATPTHAKHIVVFGNPRKAELMPRGVFYEDLAQMLRDRARWRRPR